MNILRTPALFRSSHRCQASSWLDRTRSTSSKSLCSCASLMKARGRRGLISRCWTTPNFPQRYHRSPRIDGAVSNLYLRARGYAQTSRSPSTSSKSAPSSESQSGPYSPPTTGLISYLPAPIIPYAELIRLDKPAGTLYLYLPCLFSTLLAAPLATPPTPLLTLLTTNALFLTGAIIMRGAGCTINDLWDRNLDPHVSRTRLRPIARRAISVPFALTFTALQLLAGFALLLQFPTATVVSALPSVLLVAAYPLAKRVMNYPQLILGLTFSWGALLGFPTLGLSLLETPYLAAALALYASNVAWTVLYDTIYAYQDIRDDPAAGIKSVALTHAARPKLFLSTLAVGQLFLLTAAGVAVGAGPIFYGATVGGAAVSLGIMIARVRLGDAGSCWWWFTRGAWFTGGAIVLGLGGEYWARTRGWYSESERQTRQIPMSASDNVSGE